MEKTEKKCFARPPKFRNRFIMMILGVTVQGFGLSLLIRLNLGTDPCTSLTQGVVNHVPISFGTAQLLCQLILFGFVIRYDLSKIGFGTIGNMVCMGYIADFFGWVWDSVLPEDFFAGLPMRLGFLIPVLIVFIAGAATYMAAGLGTSPYDGVPFIIADHVHKLSFRMVRMIWDICVMAIGAVLGGDVGPVTIVAAFFIGPVIAWVGKRLERFIR
ncbi:MAG: hypothetical protein HFH95_04855 [Lachnospiraceae bacterium]|nr:hypothetical protein [uncultured Acetatifactor sp.]MCI8542630.1 hypothetical protein [Lachnospiraceae bacterium]